MINVKSMINKLEMKQSIIGIIQITPITVQTNDGMDGMIDELNKELVA